MRASVFISLLIAVLSAGLGAANAQTPVTTGQTIVVIPFENRSNAPGLEWISESFPELLEERLNSPSIFVASREDRLRAYDRLGILSAGSSYPLPKLFCRRPSFGLLSFLVLTKPRRQPLSR